MVTTHTAEDVFSEKIREIVKDELESGLDERIRSVLGDALAEMARLIGGRTAKLSPALAKAASDTLDAVEAKVARRRGNVMSIEAISDVLRGKPGGLRAEEVSAALGIVGRAKTRKMSRVLKAGTDSGIIAYKGEKRGRRYSLRSR